MPVAGDVGSTLMGFGRLAVMVAIVVAIISIGNWFNDRRTAKYEAWAKSQGFGFVRHDKPLGGELRAIFNLSGHGHRSMNIVVMPSSYGQCLYGIVQWTEGSGKDKKTYKRAFVRFDLRAPLPYFRIKPEGMLSRKYNDIATEWDDFNREWEIRAQDRAFALALLSPVMQEFIMHNMRGIDLRIDGRYAYIKLKKYEIEQSVGYRSLMEEWVQRVPPFLWQGAPSQ